MDRRTLSLSLRGQRSLTIVGTLIMVLAAFVLTSPTADAAVTKWYVNCAASSDGNGQSTSTAWNNLTSVNAHTFTAGDSLYFAKGTSCAGQLALQGSGASGSPIVIGAWTAGLGSAMPIIAGGGVSPAAVYLHDNQYVTVSGLKVTNTSSTAGDRTGILAYNDTSSTLSGITITGNTVDHVNGYLWGYYGANAGIAIDIDGALSSPGIYNGVSITNNNLWEVDRAGIWVGSLAEAGTLTARSINVTISGNQMTQLGADGIVVRYTSGAQVLNNVVYNSGTWTGGTSSGSPTYSNPRSAAIWAVNSTSPLVQGNEVYGYVSQGVGDGEALDCDLHTTGCVMQYNYSHNNVDGFWLDCSGTAGAGEVLRYNISQDDATTKNALFDNQGCAHTPTPAVYNNTVYIGSGSPTIVGPSNDAWGTAALFSNNIIDNQGSGSFTTSVTWDHTLFYGSTNRPTTNTNPVVGDPAFVSPNGGGNGVTTAASAYALTSGSAAIGAGTAVSGSPSKDFAGNTVCTTPDIGALQNLC